MQLDPREQISTAHFANDRTLDRSESIEKVCANSRSTFDQSLGDQRFERGQSDRRGNRIAPERAAVVSWRENLHYLAVTEQTREAVDG